MQFTYKRIEPEKPTESSVQSSLSYKTYIDSFSLEDVLRSYELSDGRRIILLNDAHEQLQDIPVKNRSGVTTSYKKERWTVQSEITLEPEDAKRFIDLYL